MQLRKLLLIGSTALVAACAAQSATTTGSHNVIMAEELARAGDVDLYEAINRMRPTFLRSRMPSTSGVQTQAIKVYYDGMLMPEGVEHIKEIAAKNIQEVRYLEPQQANTRFGGSHSGGAIVIITKK